MFPYEIEITWKEKNGKPICPYCHKEVKDGDKAVAFANPVEVWHSTCRDERENMEE